MTRRGIIASLAALASALLQNQRASAQGHPLAEISWGRMEPITAEQRASYEACLEAGRKTDERSWLCLEPQSETVPGTARFILYLDELEGIEVRRGEEMVFVGREEIWKALK